MNAKKQIPCLEGWFTMPPEEPQLIGNKCGSCGHFFFPRVAYCRNPFCDKKKPLEKVVLSRKGKLIAYTINHYPPPPPYHAPDPFVPFGVVSVGLPEGIRVGGQVPKDVDVNALKVGMEMETVREVLYVDDQGNEVLSWMFRPATS
jgi:uncharacterized OB-fold protein